MNLPLRLALFLSCLADATSALNSTILNPILPGFYPDPSCIFVKEFDGTFFCASSSFVAFPGIPITASKDLQNWTLIGHAFSRHDQLPEFASPITEVGGIWAPTFRYNNGTFFLTTTLVFDYLPVNDSSRWRNFILTSTDPYDSASWSDPLHFEADGYDSSLFWDDDGQVYVTWAPLAEVRSGIFQSTIDLNTGNVGKVVNIWNGTGGAAPEGPHVYKKDGFYYLIIAEGGTFLNHMVTIARATSVNGPYEANPDNPILTNANSTDYFQAAGHADLFQDVGGSWWGVAHAMRVNLQNRVFPMGRETVLFPVTWKPGQWPVPTQVEGIMSGWEMLRMEIKASNATHYAFSAGPAAYQSQMMTVAYARASLVRPIFTGALLGAYATSNNVDTSAHACVIRLRYQGDGQFWT
ncbi:Non-reducing end alpha-L-arabinofuranosidase BoGH43A [Colletotrichum fructicola]|nr:Non-reducing end alpha-L-arabinofuranosidase BoGH43A [Colletotrichum fructicola]